MAFSILFGDFFEPVDLSGSSDAPSQEERTSAIRESLEVIDKTQRGLFEKTGRYTESFAQLNRVDSAYVVGPVSAGTVFVHPGVTAYLDVSRDGKDYYVYLSSGDAACHLQREGRLITNAGEWGMDCPHV